MLSELEVQLNSFLRSEGMSGTNGDDDVGRLLEDATLLTLLVAPHFIKTKWPSYVHALWKTRSSEGELQGERPQLHIALIAEQVPRSAELRPTQLESLAASLARSIDALESSGAISAASIGHLVAGYLYMYARDPSGLRTHLLERAEKHFIAADNQDCPTVVRAFAKLGLGEARLISAPKFDRTSVFASYQNFADANAMLESLSKHLQSQIYIRVRAQVLTGIAASGYLLSRTGKEDAAYLRALASQILVAVGRSNALPVNRERWAKAAMTLALVYMDMSDAQAETVATTGAGSKAWSELDEEARAMLKLIVSRTRESVPEIWARAQVYLARLNGQQPGAAQKDVVPHYEAALTVFGKSECPETWSEIQGELGAFLLNSARFKGDKRGVEISMERFEAASRIDDPLRDTERNALQRFASVLMVLNRREQAASEMERALEAGEFVLARAASTPAQRAEGAVLSTIAKQLALLQMQAGNHPEAMYALVRAIELDFAYGLLFRQEAQSDAERNDRLVLGTTALERTWNHILPFARTEHELNPIRIGAGRRLAAIVKETMRHRRASMDAFQHKIALEAQVPAGGALIIPLAGTEGHFVVLRKDHDYQPELVSTPYGSYQGLLEALFGVGMRLGWLAAYLRSLRAPSEGTGFFGGQPAIFESQGRALSVTLVPGGELDPGDTMPKEKWIAAIDDSTRAAWRIIEPLHQHLHGTMHNGAPILFMGEPLLAMLPLAAAWRHISGKPSYLAEDWSIGVVPAASVLAAAERRFEICDSDSAVVVIDPTRSLPFAAWEYVAIASSHPALKVEALGGHQGTTQKAVLNSLVRASVFHFACHAQYDSEDALDSYIDLGDGQQLSARDIISELELSKCKLVVISACETGLLNTSEAVPDRYVGLATAFLKAGAERVIATLWSVSDLSTMLLMKTFYEELAAMPPIVALRNAQLAIRDITAAEVAAELQQLGQHKTEISASSSMLLRSSALEQMITHFKALPKTEQPFQHAYHWSGFVHYGAPL